MTGWNYLFNIHCAQLCTINGTDFRETDAQFLDKVGELEFYADPRGKHYPPIMIYGERVGSYTDYELPTLEHLLEHLGKLEYNPRA